MTLRLLILSFFIITSLPWCWAQNNASEIFNILEKNKWKILKQSTEETILITTTNNTSFIKFDLSTQANNKDCFAFKINKDSIFIAPLNMLTSYSLAGKWAISELTDSILRIRRNQTARVRNDPFGMLEVGEPINKTSHIEQKKDYHSNGMLASIGYFKDTTIFASQTEAHIFDYDYGFIKQHYPNHTRSIPFGIHKSFTVEEKLFLVNNYNTSGKLLFSDEYLYLKNGELQFIKRTREGNEKYIIAHKDSIAFSRVNFFSTEEVPSKKLLSIAAHNLSDRDVTFKINRNTNIMVGDTTMVIGANDSIEFNIPYSHPSGFINQKIKISGLEWSVNLLVRGFGYNLTSSDFKNKNIKVIPKEFYYLRTGDEYQLRVLDSSGKAKYFPLSKERLSIRLRKGTYNFTINGPTSELNKKIIVK